MSAGRYHSQVFDAAELWVTRLQETVWPDHHVTGRRPEVYFGDVDPSLGAEIVAVNTDFDPTSSEWATTSLPGRNEVIVLTATIRSEVPNTRDSLVVLRRLKELAHTVEGSLFDVSTGQPYLLGFDGEVNLPLVTGVQPGVFPAPEGWAGLCSVFVRMQARI